MSSPIRLLVLMAIFIACTAEMAMAHEPRHYGWHDVHRHHDHAGVHRSHRMPRWLRLEPGFREWYLRSHRRHDYRLSWHQLYGIYRWELGYRNYRRYDDDRYHRYGYRHSPDWYRRYWRDYEDRRRHRYHRGRRY